MSKTIEGQMAKALGKDTNPTPPAPPEAKTEQKPEAQKPEVTTKATEGKPQSAPTLEQSAGKKQSDGQKPAQADDKKEADDKVPVWKVIDLKNQIAELKQSQAEDKQLIREAVNLLKDLKVGNATKSEEKSALDAFADKWQANPEMIKELAKVLGNNPAEAEKKLLDQNKEQSKPTETPKEAKNAEDATEKYDSDLIEVAVDNQLRDFLKDMPEYSDIVNSDAIKAIVFSNPKKYMKQNISAIVEQVYGKTIQGKRSADGYKPTGESSEKIDYTKVKGDSPEWEAIKADSVKTEEYKESLVARLRKQL